MKTDYEQHCLFAAYALTVAVAARGAAQHDGFMVTCGLGAVLALVLARIARILAGPDDAHAAAKALHATARAAYDKAQARLDETEDACAAVVRAAEEYASAVRAEADAEKERAHG